MSSASRSLRCTLAATLALLALAGGSSASPAQELAIADAEPFLGEWALAMEIQGNPVTMTLRVADEDTLAVAYLTSPRSPEPQKIVDLARDGEALVLSWQRDMGGQTADLHLKLAPTASGLAGDFGDASGFFSAQVTGTREAGGAQQRAGRRRPGGGAAQLALDAGLVEIGFEPLDRDGNARDFAALQGLGEGDVFAFDGGRAIKLSTVPSLRFGEVTVATGNVAPDYPGVYSLWLQRAASGWALIFNEHADIWGTQREAEADVLSVPLRQVRVEEDQPKLQVSLDGAGSAGTLVIAWGDQRWEADFTAIP